MLKKILFQAHWFVGITAGIVLALVGITGAMLSFEEPILDWLNADVRFVEERGGGVLDAPELLSHLEAAHPERRIIGLVVSSDPRDAARVTFATAETQAGAPGRGPRGESRYVDPYDATLIEGSGERGVTFFRTTMQLHRWLTAGEIGNREVGKQIVGASTLLLIFLAISGVYLRWPRLVTDWRSWLALDTRMSGRSFLWHLHAVAGTWVLVLYLVMALTGLYWSYDWYRGALYSMAGVEAPVRRGPPGGGAAPGEVSVEAKRADLHVVWSAFLRETSDEGYSRATLNLAAPAAAPLEIRYLDAEPRHERAFNTIAVDAASGAVVRHERYVDKPFGARMMASIFPLHSGSFFGLTGTIFFMLASAAMPVFSVTGWMLYLDRRRKKYAARATQRTVLSGNARPGVVEDLLIGVGSQTGFARELAWQTAGSLQAAGLSVRVESLARLGHDELARARQALFVVSTFGQGEPPDEARPFMRNVMTRAASLAGMRFGVLALGDRKYTTFCEFGRSLEEWLRRHGAEPLFPRIEVDGASSGALAEWRARLGEFTGASSVAWEEAPLTLWRLSGRRLLNPGSQGSPVFHLELQPFDAALVPWEPGAIAQVSIPVASGREPTVRSELLREFSIASLPSEGCVQLLVRQAVRADGTIGAGSGWLTTQLELGGAVQMRVRANPTFSVPDDARPMILIGNGTGIAGLLGLLKARARAGHGRNWLVFGERNERCDFYYREQLSGWLQSGVLQRLDLAFSRDGAERIYVQHKLLAAAADVRTWVEQGACIYVCGSAEGMAPGVHAALASILGEVSLEELIEQGRYRRDVY